MIFVICAANDFSWFQGPHLCKSEKKFSSLLSFIDFFFLWFQRKVKRVIEFMMIDFHNTLFVQYDSQRQVLQWNPFFHSQLYLLRNEVTMTQNTWWSIQTVIKKCTLQVICKNIFTILLPIIFSLHSDSLLASFVWKAQSYCLTPTLPYKIKENKMGQDMVR